MILSMTGYGKSEIIAPDFTVRVEMKSLNSKYFDCQVKLPKEFYPKEIEIRKQIEQVLERGKITVNIEVQFMDSGNGIQIVNETLFKEVYKKLKNLANEVNDTGADLFKLALYMPDVLIAPLPDEQMEDFYQQVVPALTEALNKCREYRIREGEKIEMEIREYLENITKHLISTESLDPERMEAIKARIGKNVRELIPAETFDQNRFEQELLYYIEKIDISEEKARLKAHLSYFDEVLLSGESGGKKLNFISQEIGREINTIGSKANFAPIQRYVVLMKEELEKIKEQLLNAL